MFRKKSCFNPTNFQWLKVIAGVFLSVLMLTPFSTAEIEPTVKDLEAVTQGKLQSQLAPETGHYRFLRAKDFAVLSADDTRVKPEQRALAFLATYGGLMGLTTAERQYAASLAAGTPSKITQGSKLRLSKVDKDSIGQDHVRFKQYYKGLPVFGGELIVHMNKHGITAVNGTFVPSIQLSKKPSIHSSVAAQVAVQAVAKSLKNGELKVEKTKLSIYRTGLLEGFYGKNLLAYEVVVSGPSLLQQVWIDAHNASVINQISLRPDSLFRKIYSPQFDPNNPNMFLQRQENGPPSLLPPVNNLFDFAGETYNFFFNGFGRDSYTGAGTTMISVYLINDVCPNAYWDGSSTNYCPTFDVDDVVSHEWGHAYTQFTHDLIYSYQSGALNESYSDIWGETVDLTNGHDGAGGSNNSQPAPNGQRWLMGEDVPVLNQPAIGILRDMWDPTRFGDPDKVSSSRYACGSGDGGGVHTNSGVPNHAFAMLVDGKNFNGQTVQGIGFIKAVHIYYRAMTVYQVPTTNFAEHDVALQTSCQDLIGADLTDFLTGSLSGQMITQNDCNQVTSAMLAVEMSTAPTQCNFQPILDPNTPAICSSSTAIFTEDWESGMDGWTPTSNGVNSEWPNYNWVVASGLPGGRSGSAAFAINEKTGTCAPGGDISGHFTLTSPVITMPAGATSSQVRFDHYVETELNFDGGNVLISVNGGSFTLVPQSAYAFNAPPSQLDDPPPLGQNTNPKAGEFAWHGTDEGESTGSWGTTIINLNSLVQPGQTFQLQFDFGIDGCNGVTGWYVDTVQIYNCPAGQGQPPAAPTQDQIQDDATPDQVNGIDKDGSYKLSWTYPAPPVEQPCGFQIEEATLSTTPFSDDAEEALVAGSNSKWSGNPQWISAPHPDTGTLSYSLAYIDNLDTSLTMKNAIAIPAGHSAVLTFDSFEDIEEDFDFGFVEVSANGGAFQTLDLYTGAFSGQRSVDLSAFAGQSIKIRFRLTSDIVFSFPLFLGWFIDNIKIQTANFTPIGTVGNTIFQFPVTGRLNGTYAYRIAGLFGDCAGSPTLGPYSNVQQITVELAPQPIFPPTASFTATPNPAEVNQNVTFDASASADNDTVGPNPQIVKYFWSFGDGATQTTTNPVTTHSYSAEGAYRVTLTVTDNDGETDTAEQLVEVTAPPQPGKQQVSGGGYIPKGGDKAHFAFNVKKKSNGSPSGHLKYDDKAGKVKVDSKGITSLTITGNRATFSGPCTVNKASGFTFTVDVIDNGEPGSNDFFRITLSNGYEASGTLAGGNIKIH